MSSRQFYITFAICVITMKMQKMPCLAIGEFGKDAYLMFLIFAAINVIGIVIVFGIFKKIDVKNVLKSSNNAFFNILKFILMIFTALYFLVQAVLMYEHIHDLFANTLFDNLSWSFFSLFLLFAVFFLAHRGIENTALNFELYTWIIVVSFVILAALGVSQTRFSSVLPFETINFGGIFSGLKNYICWFGDFFLIAYLLAKTKEAKLSKTLLVYILSMLFITFLVVVFVGIYDKLAPLAPGLITVISEQSLLDLSLGRVDWFFILFTEMGAILACSVNLYFAGLSLHVALPKLKPIYLKIFNAAAMYVLDVFLLVDLNSKIKFFCGFMNYVALGVIVVTILALVLVMLSGKFKREQNFGETEKTQNFTEGKKRKIATKTPKNKQKIEENA